MGYLLKAVVGGALFLGAVALFNVKLIALLETGTCASGNTPYEIARPCPEGTGANMMLLIGSIFAGLIGAGVFAVRGRPPWRERARDDSTWNGGLLAWAVFFTATGVVSLVHAINSETLGPDGELGGIIVGATFLLMGLPALALVVWLAAGQWRQRRSGDTGTFATGPGAASLPTHASSEAGSRSGWISSLGGSGPAGGGGFAPTRRARPAKSSRAAGPDTISRLERLQKLREAGALTEAEFELQKSRILSE